MDKNRIVLADQFPGFIAEQGFDAVIDKRKMTVLVEYVYDVG